MDPWGRVRTADFWRWLFGGDADFEDAADYALTVPAGGAHGLRAEVSEGASVTLVDLETGAELGWLDDAHFHPNCLRVEEVVQLSAAQASAGRRHEALLLLLPFAVATTDTDVARLERAVDEAWRALGFTGARPDLAFCWFGEAQAEWYLDARGRWCLRQPSGDLSLRPLYTLRVAENPDFPAWLSALGRDR